MNTIKSFFALALLFILPFLLHAQATDKPEMADGLYASGKIYVVVTVLAIILTGIFIYLFVIDRKVSALEKKMNKN